MSSYANPKDDPYFSDWEGMGLAAYGSKASAPAPKPLTSVEKNRIAMREKYRQRKQGKAIKLKGSRPMRVNATSNIAYSKAKARK